MSGMNDVLLHYKPAAAENFILLPDMTMHCEFVCGVNEGSYWSQRSSHVAELKASVVPCIQQSAIMQSTFIHVLCKFHATNMFSTRKMHLGIDCCCAMQARISYGKKPSEAFLLHYGFVDTSYKADFYSADLLEYVVQQEAVPAARVTALAANQKLHKALESVSTPTAPGLIALLRPCCTPVAYSSEIIEHLCGNSIYPLLHGVKSQ